jgi:hypothetical protein
MSVEIELGGSYLYKDKKFDLEIFLETSDGKKRIIYKKRDGIEPILYLNNPFMDELQVTVCFVLTTYIFHFKKIKEEKRVTFWPPSPGFHDLVKNVNIRFVNKNGTIVLDIVRLRMKFTPPILIVDPITGKSPIWSAVFSNADRVTNFHNYINKVNRANIIAARDSGQNYVDILKFIHCESTMTFSGTTDLQSYLEPRTYHMKGTCQIKGTIQQKPRYYYLAKRYPIKKFNSVYAQKEIQYDSDVDELSVDIGWTKTINDD